MNLLIRKVWSRSIWCGDNWIVRSILPYTTKSLCWMGVHLGWYLERQYMEDATVLSIFGLDVFEDCVHLIDHCPHCDRRWRSLLAPDGRDRHFTELLQNED